MVPWFWLGAACIYGYKRYRKRNRHRMRHRNPACPPMEFPPAVPPSARGFPFNRTLAVEAPSERADDMSTPAGFPFNRSR